MYAIGGGYRLTTSWCFGDGGNALVATTWATSVCDKDIDDGIALEKDDDKKNFIKAKIV